jgi:hypothetical protein
VVALATLDWVRRGHMIFTAAAVVLAIAVALWARRPPKVRETTTPVDFEKVGTAVLQASQYAKLMAFLMFAILIMLGVIADRISAATGG